MRQIPLSNRATNSDLIIEGKVVSKKAFWNAAHNMIYTSNTIEVYKVFKGNLTTTSIEILTMGGTVGFNKITVEPSLNLNLGEIGIFTCENVKRYTVPFSNRTNLPQYEAYASSQGFVKYDLESQTASDPFNKYSNIESEVYSKVLSPALKTWKVVAPFDINQTAAQRSIQDNQSHGTNMQIQSISGISPLTVTAGTGTQITITGTGFGATQGSGTVGFKNADDGGATFITPLASQYISWSSTQIVVEVPSNAGTGVIQVTQGATQTSSQTLTVNYAHLNVDFDPGPGTIAYQTDHIDDNGSGGYTWRMNTAFNADASANASFMRAFNEWRCNTNVNWTIGATTSINDAVSDGTNIICFDNTAPLSAGILGVCYSYWSGCASGPNIIWYVNELDIIFDEGSNISPLTWEYGTAAPSGSEYDFETVAVHELGHGHQLGHVIQPGAIMHYAISNGTSNRSLGSNDLAGGNFVQAKSIVTNICGPGAMTNHSCGTPPVASFSGAPTSVCAGQTVSFTDLSTNTPTAWAWSFPGGTPSSSTSKNPTITYNTPGTYDVSLTATNASGSDPVTINGYITVSATVAPSVIIGQTVGSNPTCQGNSVTFTATPTNGGTTPSYQWKVNGSNVGSNSSSYSSSSLSDGDAITCVLTSNASCVSTSTAVSSAINMNVNAVPTVSINASLSTICSGNSTTLTATGATTYLWNTGSTASSIIVSPSGTTGYTVTGTTNGCSDSFSKTITVNTLPNVTINANPSTICSGASSTLTASGANTYLWNTGATTAVVIVSPTSNTSYTVTGVDANGCMNEAVSNIAVNSCLTNTTQLISSQCNTTLTVLNESVRLYCNPVSGATDFEWQFTDVSTGNVVFTKKRGWQWTDFYLTGYWPTIQYNKTYSIKVRAYVGGVWSTYGNPCTVTTPTTAPASMVNTQLTTAYCNQTLTSLNSTTKIYCNIVQGATDYEWQFSNSSTGAVLFTKRRQAQWSDFYLKGYWSTIQLNTTYNVKIRAYVNGQWSAFGNVCTLTTPSAFSKEQYTDAEIARILMNDTQEINIDENISIYPNPNRGEFTIDLESSRLIEISNVLGQTIVSEILPEGKNTIKIADQPAGIYFVKINFIDKQQVIKIIKE